MGRGATRRKTILTGLTILAIFFLIMFVSGCGPVVTGLRERQADLPPATGNPAGSEKTSLEHQPPDQPPAVEKGASGNAEQATAGSGSAARPPAFTFAVLGDSKILPGFSSWRGNRILTGAVEKINAARPDLVFYLGDGPDRGGPLVFMTAFRSCLDKLAAPWYPVVGNHEILGGASPDGLKGDGEQNFRQVFADRLADPGKVAGGETYYSFDFQNAHFIVLDTAWQDRADPSLHRLRPGSPQWAWLVQDLQQAGAAGRHIFIFTHEPPVSPFPAGGPDTPADLGDGRGTTWSDAAEARAFVKLAAAWKVDAVFCGHVHMYDDLNFQGMRQVISAGAGAKLYAPPENGGFFHYLLVRVSGEGVSIAVCRL